MAGYFDCLFPRYVVKQTMAGSGTEKPIVEVQKGISSNTSWRKRQLWKIENMGIQLFLVVTTNHQKLPGSSIKY